MNDDLLFSRRTETALIRKYIFKKDIQMVGHNIIQGIRNSREARNLGYRKKDIRARVKRIGGGYQGTKEEFIKVLEYWKPYGIKPARIWYDLYCDGMDAYDPRFIPDPIWFQRIVPYFNNMSKAPAYNDKGIYNKILKGIEKPDTIVKNMEGYYYDGDDSRLITRAEAEKLCALEDHLIIKPSGGYKGQGIMFFDRGAADGKSISQIFDTMKCGFVVQRIVKQHADLARLNPDSLNTVRVISFHFKGEVHILSAQLRIGGAGSRVDNVSAGGSACAIKPDGWLHEKSVTRKSTWTDETPNGIKLKDVCIPNYDGIIKAIKNLHRQLPYYDIVGWDFAVREDGTPVFIEFNTKPGQNQIGGREPTFGDLSDDVFEEVFIKKTLGKIRGK